MRLLALVFIAALGACGGEETNQGKAEHAAKTEPPAFVGRWAADPSLCADGAWELTAEGFSTAGEVSCRFEGVAEVSGGYETDAECVAQAPPTQHVLRLRMEQPDALVIEGGPTAPISLQRCD